MPNQQLQAQMEATMSWIRHLERLISINGFVVSPEREDAERELARYRARYEQLRVELDEMTDAKRVT